MIEFNKLTFNNKSTADFDFEIIVETSPSLKLCKQQIRTI